MGDVIQLIAPDNETFNQQFYVKYIDLTKIVLGNINTMQVISLSLTDGQINDRDIQSIELLSRAEYPGYARQNKLVSGVWLNIYFKGLDGVPFIVTGIITDLEEDSIQITTYPNRDIIYIDFGYKGLPENLPIEKIVKTNKPERGMVGVEETRESELITTNVEGDEFGTTINEEMNDRLNEIILDADRLMLGEDLDEITLFDEIDESNRRYGIEKQMTDLLDELLSEVPNYKRTISVQNDIHTMIERYSQLRTLFSNFDSNGNANMPAPLNNGRKPIIDNIVNLNQNFHWLLPVSYNIKKLYNLDAKDEFDDSDGIIAKSSQETFENEMTITETYENGKVPTENKFLHLFKSLNTLYTPFMNPLDSIDNITSQPVNTSILSVIDNLGDLESYVAKTTRQGKEVNIFIKKKKFLLETYTLGLRYQKYNISTQLTPPDSINIKSILTLTLPMLLYSRINLPTTTILDRAQLNRVNMSYWELLNNKTDYRPLTIDNFDDEPNNRHKSRESRESRGSESGYESDTEDLVSEFKETFLNEIRHYILDDSLFGESDKYARFLNQVIPTNSQIFNILKTHIPNNLSFYAVIKFLEVFNIYQHDITETFYIEIKNFVDQNIMDYKKTLASNNRLYGSKKSSPKKSSPKKSPIVSSNSMLNALSSDEILETIVLNMYKLEKDRNYSNSEILSIITRIDYGRLFSMALVKINLDLQVTTLVDNFVKKYEELINEKQLNQNTCRIISKKYSIII